MAPAPSIFLSLVTILKGWAGEREGKWGFPRSRLALTPQGSVLAPVSQRPLSACQASTVRAAPLAPGHFVYLVLASGVYLSTNLLIAYQTEPGAD